MNFSVNQIIITVLASMLSGVFASLISYKKNQKSEKIRIEEKAHDNLILELKDLQIKLYRLEKDLDEWKDKYYEALQELIHVKAELEDSIVKLTHSEIHMDLEG